MGNCCPCFKSAAAYEPIPSEDIHAQSEPRQNTSANAGAIASATSLATNREASSAAPQQTAFHTVPDAADTVNRLRSMDLETPVFKGAMVEQKFSNKSAYDRKFAWVS